MYLLEIFFLIVLFTFLIAQNIKGLSRKISLSIFLIGAIIVLLTILMGQFRWQLTLAYLLYAILALTLLKKTSSRIALRSTGVILGIILLIISMTLALALPIVTLPKPDGPYVVGSRTFSLIDKSRDESYFGGKRKGKRGRGAARDGQCVGQQRGRHVRRHRGMVADARQRHRQSDQQRLPRAGYIDQYPERHRQGNRTGGDARLPLDRGRGLHHCLPER